MSAKIKSYLRTIHDQGLDYDFVEFLLHSKSIVIKDYAKVFCQKNHIKAIDYTDEEHKKYMEDIIRIAKTSWLDD